MKKKGLKILEVEQGSPAEEAGLMIGDRILTIDGCEITDELALKFYLADDLISMRVIKPGGEECSIELDLSDGSFWGAEVEEFTTKTCNNACIFCFVDQLPKDVRSSLLVKDDDYRLSFLHGNYVTLTNISESEIDRIVEQRLSPLYVSVHSTDLDLRARILGRKKRDDLDGKLDRLIRGGIQIHAQIVLMPGINDGTALKKTVRDLYQKYPGIQSVAIVPIGLSKHGAHKDQFKPISSGFCRKLIHEAQEWQAQFRRETGTTFAYLADEFYIQGAIEIPESEHYDDFAQIEDGIGMTRSFLDEFEIQLQKQKKFSQCPNGAIATGKLFYPTLNVCIKQLNKKTGARIKTYEAENLFLGRKITVAGLLSGRDILKALQKKDIGNFLIIPEESLSRVDRIFIDDLTIDDLSRDLGKPVYSGGRTVQEFFKVLRKAARK